MDAEIINSTINIGSMLLGTLIAYGYIPIPIPPDKIQKWEKAKRILKIVAPIGLVAFILVELLKHE